MYSITFFWIVLVGLAGVTIISAQLPLQIEPLPDVHGKASVFHPTKADKFNEVNFRLGDDFIPIQYDIQVQPILTDPPSGKQEFTAPGASYIKVKCQSATNRITLSATNLTFTSITVNDGTTDLPINQPVIDAPNQYVNITLQNGQFTIDAEYTITLVYTAEIALSKTGLYRADYKDKDGNQKWIATTQFETVGFRQMTPGFDEPRFKAVFQISVCRLAGQNTLGNTLPNATESASPVLIDCPAGWEWDHFHATPVMSSYLIALVISEFTCEAANLTIFGKPVGICGPPELIDDRKGGVYAANQSAFILKTFENLLGEKYPLAKMDSVAIPRDYFQFGAMENWGLNTYRDNLLLFYNGESQETNRRQIANILSHELAHQWFGNLVTTFYWSDIWLNEGFATYMSYIAQDVTQPEYEVNEQFVYSVSQVAMRFDASSNTHPVINTAKPEEVISMSIFDDISYDKGGSLIRMMEGFMGRDTLFKGLKSYLNKQQFKPVNQNLLFEDVGLTAGEDGKLPEGLSLKDIMDTWTVENTGYPLIRVSVGGPDRVYLSQERFRNNDHNSDLPDPDYLWEVPISVATEANPDFKDHSAKLWLGKNIALQSYGIDTTKWIVINPEAYGYYRVLYDSALLRLIQQQLESDPDVIAPMSRSQLLDDYFTFAQQGYVSVETALSMTKFLVKESNHAVWAPVISYFSTIRPIFSANPNSTTYKALQNYLAPKIASALGVIGWKQVDEHGVQVILRATLLDWACALEHEDCFATAKHHFEDWTVRNIPIPLDVQPTVYCAGVAGGNESDFQTVLSAFREQVKVNTEASATQITRLLNGLGCTNTPVDRIWLLRYSIEDIDLKPYVSTILQNFARNSETRDIVLAFIKDNVQRLVNDFGIQLVASVLNTASTYQYLPADLDQHYAFINYLLLKDQELLFQLGDTLTAITRKISVNIQVLGALLPVERWLQENSS